MTEDRRRGGQPGVFARHLLAGGPLLTADDAIETYFIAREVLFSCVHILRVGGKTFVFEDELRDFLANPARKKFIDYEAFFDD